ncbi:MAG: cysteine desulfuration protein SufE [Alphaproteobacteria bacterium]|nr:cysteine desulfuration protein SufE [Alphaproteobacteria bacterium]
MSIEQIIDDFSVLDDWDERYRYIIELGRQMAPLPEASKTDLTKVRGCVSQVWLTSRIEKGASGQDVIVFEGESDAMIVRGLIAILLRLYSGKTADEILAIDAKKTLGELGLDTHLSQQRSNGLFAMVERIRSDARKFTKARA